MHAPRLRGRRFSRATLVAPQAEAGEASAGESSAVELDLDLDDMYVSIEVPQLDLWAVVALSDSLSRPIDPTVDLVGTGLERSSEHKKGS